MVNKPKAIGTAGETAVVRYLQANGFPFAERRALHGTVDLGDVTGIPDMVVEVKAGHSAWNASDNQIDKWLGETETERGNAKASVGLLVVARRQKPPAAWWCVMSMRTQQHLLGYVHPDPALADFPCYTTLARAVEYARRGGWGDPLLPSPQGSAA